jgi:hypothetical protein
MALIRAVTKWHWRPKPIAARMQVTDRERQESVRLRWIFLLCAQLHSCTIYVGARYLKLWNVLASNGDFSDVVLGDPGHNLAQATSDDIRQPLVWKRNKLVRM